MIVTDQHTNGAAPGAAVADQGASDAAEEALIGRLIGRIGSPPRLEATSQEFHFWANRDQLVEKNQIVRTRSTFGHGRTVTFYGLVQEVRRVSRTNDMAQEFDKRDGMAQAEVNLKPEGITYATVNILRAADADGANILTPPLEESEVRLGDAEDAAFSYGFDRMKRPLAVGQLRNGASAFAGLGKIDLHYLLGQISGHMNVSGMTGLGAKSTFLLTFLKLLLHEAQPQTGKETLHVVPLIFNVKGHDLMWIDHPHQDFDANKHGEAWQALGVEPTPFVGTQFYAPAPIPGCNPTLYSWSLRDVLARGLFRFLFDDDNASDNMRGLMEDILNHLTQPDGVTLRADRPQTWRELRTWIVEQVGLKDKNDDDPTQQRAIPLHTTGTWRAVARRLWDILSEGSTIFPPDTHNGKPLHVERSTSSPPQVIDIAALPYSLKRFVVAAVAKQVMEARGKPDAVSGLAYLLMLDELNRFAPRDARDAITRKLEEIALEGRSRGVILLGAQQFASQVSQLIVESAAIRVAGCCGTGEMEDKVWKSWSQAARQQACSLQLDEKLISQSTFRAPMLVRLPHPAWAMRKGEIGIDAAELPQM